MFNRGESIIKNMTEKEKYEKNSFQIDYFGEKLGETIFNAMTEDEFSSCDLGCKIYKIFDQCETEKEFEIANAMVIAFCGYSMNALIEKIQQQDKEDYQWESF